MESPCLLLGEIQGIHKYVNCRRKLTEIMLKVRNPEIISNEHISERETDG